MRHREIAKTHDIVYLVSATGRRIPIVNNDIIEGNTAVVRAVPCISLKAGLQTAVDSAESLVRWRDSRIVER
jgi:hypothetical protein